MEVQTVLLAALMAGIVATAVTVLIEKYGGVMGGGFGQKKQTIFVRVVGWGGGGGGGGR